jgi:dTDP-4-dehydrorhamnose reductase
MEAVVAPTKKTLFTGGSGLLGRHVREYAPGFSFPVSSEFNVVDYGMMEAYIDGKGFEVVVHAAAMTSPPRVNSDPMAALDANLIGTANVVKLCSRYSLRLLYISTDYVFRGDRGNYREDDSLAPRNLYAWSKLGGECAVRMHADSLIIRTSFGPKPFPYDKAFVDQWTSRETAAIIAAKVIRLVDSDLSGVVHIGGPRRTVYEYATTEAEGLNIGELHIDDVIFAVPKDTSLDCSLYDSLFVKE